ncbi:LytTr DNA-binding domain-containing protein [Flagellimonas pacifica]|uniref:LytTr DNA-binding domain-containing protein n=2 Tax=Flagellimonas pacifica TaxID=1247520 RepID=A0A285MZ14_9FLAO|nr:LytTr DNA-binding domain-containing protein [Allomuricauda parva]
MALGKMGEVLDLLPENKFVRIHKSHIVQVNKIKSIEDNRVIIGCVKLSISNTYRAGFYNKINSMC